MQPLVKHQNNILYNFQLKKIYKSIILLHYLARKLQSSSTMHVLREWKALPFALDHLREQMLPTLTSWQTRRGNGDIVSQTIQHFTFVYTLNINASLHVKELKTKFKIQGLFALKHDHYIDDYIKLKEFVYSQLINLESLVIEVLAFIQHLQKDNS